MVDWFLHKGSFRDFHFWGTQGSHCLFETSLWASKQHPNWYLTCRDLHPKWYDLTRIVSWNIAEVHGAADGVLIWLDHEPLLPPSQHIITLPYYHIRSYLTPWIPTSIHISSNSCRQDKQCAGKFYIVLPTWVGTAAIGVLPISRCVAVLRWCFSTSTFVPWHKIYQPWGIPRLPHASVLCLAARTIIWLKNSIVPLILRQLSDPFDASWSLRWLVPITESAVRYHISFRQWRHNLGRVLGEAFT